MNFFRKWGKIIPLDPDRVPYHPAHALHSVMEDFPKAKAVVILVIDQDDASYIRVSDMEVRDLCYASQLIQSFVQRKVRGDE